MPTFRTVLTVLGRWPRRLAALACLLLAAASALAARRPAAIAAPPRHPASAVGPGERAVPVRLGGVDARAYLHPGDRVDLLAAPGERAAIPLGTSTPSPTATAVVVAEGVRVLSIVTAEDGHSDSALIVAADRAAALRIAALGDATVLAVSDNPP